MAYIGRDGELMLEMDAGEVAIGKGSERAIVDDWNLSVDANRRFTERAIQRRAPPKLVHNLIFSMPTVGWFSLFGRPGVSGHVSTSCVVSEFTIYQRHL